ncbi:LptF/LptG family permease [uncultured Sanguibacteroides sp.]|uniref:LptF/LptG family permease n=1 Tax=uncultured Sanguibacteroides sp. TaxID=1635151 RepID=UPI0025EE64EC|nr:LptF/LptG family permease [uncultured Sanguibacteroides sp.]
MKKLDIYIIRKFLGTFFFSMVLILSIVIVFDLSERLEKFIENSAPVNAIIFDYYLNFVPYFANVFSSLFTFISVIFFTSKMAYNSEIIAILSTGTSFSRMVRPYMISAGVIAILSLLLTAFIIPNANKKRIEFSEKYIWKTFQNREKNIHRQVAPGSYIYMSSFSVGPKVGYDFSYENFRGDTLINKLNARLIEWNENKGKWTIKDWTYREFDGMKETYTTGRQIDTLLNFTPAEFSEDPKKIKERLTLPELNEYIDRQKLRGSSNVVEFQIEKYRIFSNAFATFILTLIGVSIASRKIRGGMGFHLGLGLLISFSYILFMQFSTVFATNGNMNPLLAVWIPNILYAFVAFFVYRTAPK